MALKFMYITNRPEIAQIAETAGVDRIFVDMEYIGKAERQGGKDTVQNHHTISDVQKIRAAITSSELLVRVNPIHSASEDYSSSKEEIERVIGAGADYIMLPYFKKAVEVEQFVDMVSGRAKTIPLVETPEAVECIEDILKIQGIDELYIGLNDLSLGYGKKFMFELIEDDTVEKLADRFKEKDIPFGFGGIAALGKGILPAEYVIKEHYRLGSSSAILSRSFLNVEKEKHLGVISKTFIQGIQDIRSLEEECARHRDYFEANKLQMDDMIRKVSGA